VLGVKELLNVRVMCDIRPTAQYIPPDPLTKYPMLSKRELTVDQGQVVFLPRI
jgi:hypothetical protein